MSAQKLGSGRSLLLRLAGGGRMIYKRASTKLIDPISRRARKMTINPILALELRQRWRNNRSFLLLLGIALALSLLTGFIYENAVAGAYYGAYDPMTGADTRILNDSARLGAIGRELFIALAHVNILSWLLIATASAATGIASERERGLLESLQLSPISARSQIAARFGANLLLLGALQLVLLPIYSLTFIMRGVSPAEVGQAFLMVAWSSFTGTAIGLWFSARAHRPTNALFSALGGIALFSAGVYVLLSGPIFFGARIWSSAMIWISLFHPSALFYGLSQPNFGTLVTAKDALILFSFAHALFCALLLWLATRNVGRNLPPASWGQKSLLVEKLRARHAATPPKSRAAQRASGVLLNDIPLDRFVHFTDPLLAREVKARFRLRRAGFWLSMVRGLLFLAVLSIWIFGVASLFDKQARSDMAPAIIHILLFGGALVLAVLSATSWTREREAGTWESLKLSLLTPREIIRAKWLSPLVSFGYYSVLLWILLPFGALFVRLDSILMGVLLVMVWLGLTVALGLLVSWRVKNGTASIAWTVGIMAMLLIGAPVLDETLGVTNTLTEWKFGIGPNEGNYAFDSYNASAIYDEAVIEAYKAETGRDVPFKPKYSVAKGTFVTTSEWVNFQSWGEDYAARATRFQKRLTAWNPTITLSDIFLFGAPGVVGQSASERVRDLATWLLFGALPPALVTLGLLWLLRRDVRREQLGL